MRNQALGQKQKLVLSLLAGGPKAITDIARHWPGLTESGVRSAIDGLANRGLVDVADRNHERGRVYRLTDKGAAAEAALIADE